MEQATIKRKQGSAFITTRKGFCYLTVKVGRSNFNIMRIRNYTLEPQDKRDMRRLYPDYFFDWKKINQQLAEKREVCRAYRSKRQAPRNTGRTSVPFVMVSYDPRTRTVYASDAGNSLTLLDAVLHIERTNKKYSQQPMQSPSENDKRLSSERTLLGVLPQDPLKASQ